jgi:hypothetical protein
VSYILNRGEVLVLTIKVTYFIHKLTGIGSRITEVMKFIDAIK